MRQLLLALGWGVFPGLRSYLYFRAEGDCLTRLIVCVCVLGMVIAGYLCPL